jgi:methanogenic corrinoid protein MtbC1
MNLGFSLSFINPVYWGNRLRHLTLSQGSGSQAFKGLHSVSNQKSTASQDDCKASLMDVIESQIIPRLLQAHPLQTTSVHLPQGDLQVTDQEQLRAFTDLCLLGSAKEAISHVERLIKDEGVPHEDIFLGLIAPAARSLGVLWEEDELDFTQVTLGLMRLQQITHHMGYEYQDGPQKPGPVRRIMLACAPGSQHILGLAIVSEFFRKDGWQVVVEIAPSQVELCHAVQNEWFDLVGLSVGLVEQISGLPDLIRTVKKASRNPETPILLGGPAFVGKEFNAQDLGASCICVDPRQGLNMAATLVNPTKLPQAV